MSSTVIYTSTVADDRFATTVTISPEGAGQLVVGSNRDRRTNPVGRFESALPRPLLRQLERALSSAEFAAAPSKTGLLPGDAYREIKVVDAGGTETSKVAGTGRDVPAAFLSAESAIQAIIEDLRAHPVVAATLSIDRMPPRVRAGTAAPFDLILRNAGRAPFRIEAPAEWGKAQTSCELAALRADLPEAELGLDHQKFASLDGSVFVAASKQPERGFLPLQPGEAVALRFRDEFNWPPGRYNIEITLSLSLLANDGSPLFSGSLVSGPYLVEVSRH